MNHDIVNGTVHTVCRHLGQDRIAAGSHIRSADHQTVKSIVIHLHGHRRHINAADGRPLHRHRHTNRTDLAIAHIAARILLIPADHLLSPVHATV